MDTNGWIPQRPLGFSFFMFAIHSLIPSAPFPFPLLSSRFFHPRELRETHRPWREHTLSFPIAVLVVQDKRLTWKKGDNTINTIEWQRSSSNPVHSSIPSLSLLSHPTTTPPRHVNRWRFLFLFDRLAIFSPLYPWEKRERERETEREQPICYTHDTTSDDTAQPCVFCVPNALVRSSDAKRRILFYVLSWSVNTSLDG